MRVFRMTALAGLVVALSAAGTQAADVAVKGVHLCCGSCVKAAGGALAKVKGVSGAQCDRDSQTVSFTATDAKTAKAGLRALAHAGLAGSATIDGKKTHFPRQHVKKGTKADTVTLRGLHLCCGKCIKAVTAAGKGIAGVSSVEADKKHRSLTLTGSGIDVNAAIAALNKAGFSGHIRRKRKK